MPTGIVGPRKDAHAGVQRLEPRYVVSSGGYIDVAKRRRDMDRFDGLPPQARAILREAPSDVDVEKLLKAYRERVRSHEEFKAALEERSLDRDKLLVDWLCNIIRQRFPLWKPLKPARNRRHAR